MEDLKGKIRVYVRIRPFSNSERERGSQEAVFKVDPIHANYRNFMAQL